MLDSTKMFFEADAARARMHIHDADADIYKEIVNRRKSMYKHDDPDPDLVSLADRQLVVVAAAHDEVVLAPESELETLHRLAEKHGMVLMQAPSETVLTEAVDPEPVNTTPRGLTMVAAMGGVRMGCAAWQRD